MIRNFEKVVKIRAVGNEIYEGQVLRFCIAYEFFGIGIVVEIFNFAKIF